MKRLVFILVAVLLLAGLAGGGYWYWANHLNKPPSFRTAAVSRGDIQLTISATGTVQPEEVIDIGAQVAGQILSFGPDPRDSSKTVDFTTPVEKDTILAQIDDTLYRSDVDAAKAALAVAKASETRAKADLDQMKAKLTQATNDFDRIKKARSSDAGAVNQSEYDQFEAAYLTCKSALAVGDASIVQATAAVTQADAALKKAEKNLGYCTIKSPVKGVIVSRRVNVGQTVVSSLNAPSLFLIAKDLKRIQVWVPVNEADIGQIQIGQDVAFTVDTFPNITFKGKVGKIRLDATMTQNVVTYTVEVNTDNSNGKLLPYLTANLQFQAGKHQNVLLVPNNALRYTPQPQQIAPDARDAPATKGQRKKDKGTENAKDSGDRGTLWARDGNFLRPLQVKVGWTDGVNTEVEGKDLSDGMEVVTGEVRDSNGGSGGSNPFAPKMFGGGSSKDK
jgi:HlyD family secretion protein